MKNFRTLFSVSLIALALATAPAHATNTSTINPNSPAQGSALSSATLRANYLAAYNDINTIYGLIANIVTSGITSLVGDVTTGTPASGVATATVARVNGVSYPASPSTNTVPVVTNTGVVTYEPLPNAAMVNSSVTIAGHTIALGGVQTLAATDLTNGVNGTGAVVLATGNVATATLAATVTTNANLTGVITSSGNATSFGSFSSAILAAALSDETGTGFAVFSNSPNLSAPNIGAATGTSLNVSGAVIASNSIATGSSANGLPTGTTGQRPSGVEGYIRDNTTLGQLEVFIGGVWKQLGSTIAKSENSVFGIGDSRMANLYVDSIHVTQGNFSEFNWANYLLGNPFNLLGTSAVSGTRTDQLFTGGSPVAATLTNGGSGYVSGVYYYVPLTGGTGTVAHADITVAGGIVTGFVFDKINSFQNVGVSYLVGDALSASNANLGGSGSGLVITLTKIQTQIQAAIASNARNILLKDGVNDLGQQYPTSSTSGATACANLQAASSQLIANGQRVILEEEYGSTADNSTQIGQLVILRQCEENYAASNVGNVILLDLAPVIYSPTSTSTSAIAFRSNYMSDGATHLGNLGAYNAGLYVKGVLQTLLPNVPSPSGIVSAFQDVTNGGSQILSNPTFLNTASISATGITGTGPTGWTFNTTNSTTATVTMQANTDSTFGISSNIGNEAVVTISCAAQNDRVRMQYVPSNSAWTITSVLQGTGGAYVEPGSTNLSGVDLYVANSTLNAASANIGTNGYAMYTENGSTPLAGTANGYSGRFLTPPVPAAPGSATQAFAALYYEIWCAGAGSAVVHLRPAGLFKLQN